jgi:hypothetical protein
MGGEYRTAPLNSVGAVSVMEALRPGFRLALRFGSDRCLAMAKGAARALFGLGLYGGRSLPLIGPQPAASRLRQIGGQF